MKIYRCNICGNILLKLKDSGVNPFCCNQKMEELQVQTTDGALEKHVPVVTIEDEKVCVDVGSQEHPMVTVHYIEWIILETTNGYQIKYLQPNDKPHVIFSKDKNETVLNVYAYCNIHGLYKS